MSASWWSGISAWSDWKKHTHDVSLKYSTNIDCNYPSIIWSFVYLFLFQTISNIVKTIQILYILTCGKIKGTKAGSTTTTVHFLWIWDGLKFSKAEWLGWIADPIFDLIQQRSYIWLNICWQTIVSLQLAFGEWWQWTESPVSTSILMLLRSWCCPRLILACYSAWAITVIAGMLQYLLFSKYSIWVIMSRNSSILFVIVHNTRC